MLQGMIAVGLFVDIDQVENFTRGNRGLFHGGGPYMLGVQVLACVCIIIWSGTITFILLFVSIHVLIIWTPMQY